MLSEASLIFERRAAEAQPDRLPQLVDDLKNKAELIITQSYAAARVVKGRSNLPVVAVTGADPVAMGLIDSLAHPGGNVTGVGEVGPELSAKRLEVLKDTFPSLRKIAMLWNADDLGMTTNRPKRRRGRWDSRYSRLACVSLRTSLQHFPRWCASVPMPF
jgi:putative ABC transport system substrate-binding protein